MIRRTALELGSWKPFRNLLRTDERLREAEDPGARVICVASGKGGTGKSILATNLAVLRAARGERVLLVDFDAGFANAHLLLGLAPHHDLQHVLRGEVSAKDALVEGPSGLQLLSGGVGRHVLATPTRRELERLFRSLEPLENEFDLVIVDHGAGVGYATIAHLAATSTLLLVANHEVTALSDAYALYKRAHLVNSEIRVGMVFNRCRDEGQVDPAWDRFRGASERFLRRAPEFVGWVPADDAVGRSVEARRPVCLHEPESDAARAIASVADWAPIDSARTVRAFFDKARRALR